nr:expressed protein [Hymenolepis microstoma]
MKRELIYSGQPLPNHMIYKHRENEMKTIMPTVEDLMDMCDEGYCSDGDEDLPKERCFYDKPIGQPTCKTPEPSRYLAKPPDVLHSTGGDQFNLQSVLSVRLSFDSDSEDTFVQD